MWKKDFSDNKKNFSDMPNRNHKEKKNFNEGRKPFREDAGRSFGGERRSFGGERRSFGGERRSFGGERRSFREDGNKSFGGERRNNFKDNDRKSFNDDKNTTVKKKSKLEIEFSILNDNALLPKYMTENATGCDIAYVGETKIIKSGEIVHLNTGIQLNTLHERLDVQLRGRSGLSSKGLLILNTSIKIKEEIKVTVINLGKEDIIIENNNRIGQLVFSFVQIVEVIDTNTLSETLRNENGFGSTGN